MKFMQSFASFVMRSRWHAAFVALICSLVPLLGIVSAAIIALVWLRRGAIEGLFVVMCVAAPYVVFAFLKQPEPLITIAWLLLPVCFLSAILRSSVSWSMTLTAGAALSSVLALLIYGVMPDIITIMQAVIQQALDVLNQQFALVPDPAQIPEISERFGKIGVGIQLAGGLFSGVMALMLARWWQSMLYHNGGFSQEFYQLRLSLPYAMALIVVTALALWVWPYAWNISIILCVPFLIAALALLHALVGLLSLSRWWLVGFYLVTAFVLPYVVMGMVVLAFADTLFDFRGRLKKKQSNPVNKEEL